MGTEKILRTTPLRTSENVLLKYRVKIALIIDFAPRRKTDPFTWKRKTNKLR